MLWCFFKDTATTETYTYVHTLSLHDALPICNAEADQLPSEDRDGENEPLLIIQQAIALRRRGRETRLVIEGQKPQAIAPDPALIKALAQDRKSTRLNSSH